MGLKFNYKCEHFIIEEKKIEQKFRSLTDFLLPTERILYHRLPKTKASTDGRIDFRPWAIGWVLIIASVFIFAFLPNRQTLELTYFIIPIGIGLFLLGIGIKPVILYKAKNVEIIITNQRVLIYPSPYAEKNRPRIINLYEVNGDIKMEYYKNSDTGSFYIPGPHWDWYKHQRTAIINLPIPQDIKHIEDPITVHKILIDAIEAGKKRKWNFS